MRYLHLIPDQADRAVRAAEISELEELEGQSPHQTSTEVA